jgi:adenylate cyclase
MQYMAEERVERRLAAILVADVVGYSRLIEQDEEGTRARLRSLLTEVIDPQITADGGRIVKTSGDGILVEFGSVVDAVRNALTIQKKMSGRDAKLPEDNRIKFRVGINLGDVIVEGDDIHGDGVNMAARLEGLCAPGEVYVSGTVRDHVEGKLNAVFDDLGEQSVKNIVKPVRVCRVQAEPGTVDSQVADTPRSLPDKPSIAVLPFTNISGDPEQEYFADGMTEDLITDLSKISGLFVIARNSSFTFKGQSVDVVEVGRKLGVKRVLEGSVRRAGNQIRINAQLIDAKTGGHLWAERYDGEFENIFALQDEITAKIVAALEVTLTSSDLARVERKPTTSIEAYDLYLRARERYYQYFGAAMAEAFELLERAIELDPEFADAHAYLSGCHTGAHIMQWPGVDGDLDLALASAQKAVALDSNSAVAHTRLGWAQTWKHRYDDAERSFDRAAALAPELAEVFSYQGVHYIRACDPERALQLTTKALRLDPFAPQVDYHMGMEYLFLGRFEEAVTKLEIARERTPNQSGVRLHLACAYVEMGRLDDAAREIRELSEFSPVYTVALAGRTFPFRIDAVRERFVDNLRKAGLPE